MSQVQMDSYPSLLWVTIPSVLILSAYFANKYYKKYRLEKYGIGKGAKGFQTNVKQLRVTPEIAERLRRGEYVSSEEIAEAVVQAEEEAKKRPPPQGVIEVGFGPRETASQPKEEPTNEWLPESVTNPKKRGKVKRR
ncbi:hypothetical protein D9756_004546 [Leucocoprinus leucothites]|uniref:Uncharacterized protein n=1 Tax=Leucocoprinus leucothites TaxID=201217 RepID=A0A8H5CTY3_9AGAR|nr:hypothetical protein D9756_011030 [Leucoagaricus leucothites]KAF5361098.1 hypothetical protein D9756_004546 [Leucoagaricus leucothites]